MPRNSGGASRATALALLLLAGAGPAARSSHAAAAQPFDAAAELARASALATRQDWSAALAALDSIRRQTEGMEPPRGLHLQVAIVYRNLGRWDESLAALDRAKTAGLPLPQVEMHRARVLARRGDSDAALDAILAAAGAGFGNLQGLTQDAELRSLQGLPRWQDALHAVDRNQRPCLHDPAFRRFDFWIGEWDVTGAGNAGTAPATSTIQLVLEGCALSEHYINAGYSGRSLTFWDSAKRRWQQTYVDSAGSVLEFYGDFEGTRLVLLGDTPSPGQGQPATRHRLSFEPLPGGSGTVRQVWEQSTDAGATWSVVFDGSYQRKQAKAATG